ncbi:multidrug resistance protein mdtg [Anaeramoeba flamelloides]|uniref:Multidrug resistance protein mdtg n=1 Tax=Anaeramoeba flamelloides TaxID=1746091 RepID=A0ABQ8X0X8_9EUKA|nr:multidrug resistance protein mdtg [Anaeramoeba flamelloides]
MGLRVKPIRFAFWSEFLLITLYGAIVSVIADTGRKYGAGEVELGIIVGIYSFGAIFGDYIMGWASDTIGRLPVLFIADLGFATSVLLTGLIENKFYLMIIRFVNGLFGGILPVGMATVADYSKKGKNEYNSLMSKILQFIGLGFMVGPIIFITFAELNMSFKNSCLYLGISFFIFTLLWNFVIPEIRQTKKASSKNDKQAKDFEEDIELVNSGEEPEIDQEIIDQITENVKQTKQEFKNLDNEDQAVDLLSNDDNEDDEDDVDVDVDNSKTKNSKIKVNMEEKVESLEEKHDFNLKLLLQKDIFLILCIQFFYNAVQIIFIYVSPLIVSDIFGLDPSIYGPISSIVVGFTQVISTFKFTAWVPEKLGILKGWNILGLLNTVLLFSLSFMPNVWLYFLVVGFISFFLTAHHSIAGSLTIYLAPHGTAGRLSGMGQIVGAAAKFLTPIVVLPIYFNSYIGFWAVMASFEIFQIIFLSLTNVAKVKTKKDQKKKLNDQNKTVELTN